VVTGGIGGGVGEDVDVSQLEPPTLNEFIAQMRQLLLLNVGVLPTNFCEQCSQLRMTLVRTTASKRAAAPMAWIRHEVKSQCPVCTAGVVAEASEW